jgi:protocatechuate 3,4-dioxygenase alpha subunit
VTGPRKLVASGSQTVGPFFHFGLTTDASLGTLVTADTPGERIRLRVRVLDADAIPVPDAMVEIYQADAAGA